MSSHHEQLERFRQCGRRFHQVRRACDDAILTDQVRGDATGLMIPAHAEALGIAGAEFLTDAFRAYGALPADNRVARVTRYEPCMVGSTGQKMFLQVELTRPLPGFSTDLFVKFSRDFKDAFRDRRRMELESEIRLGELSREPSFPIDVPRPYFGDFNRESGSGLFITEQIAFGRGGIEPLHRKCMDHSLREPLEYYRTIFRALARLAAAHKSGLLSAQIDAAFPFDRAAAIANDPIPLSEDGLRERIARYATFTARCPQLLPARLTTPDFIARFEEDALHILRSERLIKQFLHADPAMIALSHFNANIDNAWFWRDARGALQCGLFDWQRARQMNVAYALWGALCSAGPGIWDDHLDELLVLFADELRSGGGPLLDPETIKQHLHLYAATMGIAGLIDAPALVLSYLPEAGGATGPLDPVFEKSEPARSFLHVFTAMLNLLQSGGVRASLERLLARMDAAQAR